MIKNLKISGFKCFQEEDFELEKITILAGINSAGKSSLIQSIMIAKEAECGVKSLSLDSLFGVNLGTAVDVINWNAVDEQIKIKVNSKEKDVFSCKLQATHDSALYLNVIEIDSSGKDIFDRNNLRNFCYLAAERNGPKAEYQFVSKPIEDIGIGIFGQNCAQILAIQGNLPIEDSERLHPSTTVNDPKFLIYQLEKWISEIVRPLKIKCEIIGGSSLATLQFKTDNEWVKASNMGYGVTYSLPIILAGLIIGKGGLLIIENPEAHLHPAGQSAMGEFIAWLSCFDIQVIVETHSDHLLNGIRIAIAENDKINASDAKVIFFDKEGIKSHYHDLSFNEFGGVSNWPKSFFDQYQIDTAKLGKFRRSKLSNGTNN